jgi:hypothetical protein
MLLLGEQTLGGMAGGEDMAEMCKAVEWKSATSSEKERRVARRFELSLSLAVLPIADLPRIGGRIPTRPADLPSGQTRDISTGGIYFTAEEELKPGSVLAFMFVLPGELTSGNDVFVCAQGKVMRTEKKLVNGSPRTGVAVTIERYEIVKEDPLYHEFFGGKPGGVRPAPSAA